jgi:hypothetical protein
MRTPRLSEPEARLLQPPEPARFSAEELEGLPDPVQRHLAQAIAPGTPLATSARLRMRGHIKVGRWLPFRARQILSPHLGFAWAARAAGVIAGSDRYLEGVAGMDWKLAGLVTVAHAEGPDVARSAAGRAGAEAIWLPTALLPRFGVRWAAGSGDRVTASFRVVDTRWSSGCGWMRPGGSPRWSLTAGATPTTAAPSPSTDSVASSPATAASRA